MDDINKGLDDRKKADYEAGQEDLWAQNYLNVAQNFKYSEDPEHKAPTREAEDLIDWTREDFHVPRRLTIKNVRDIMFGLMNQSKAQERIYTAEAKIRDLYDKCA